MALANPLPDRLPAAAALPPGEGFLDAVAAAMLARIKAAGGKSGDFPDWLVLAPSLPIAAELRQSFIRVIGRPVMLPRFDVLSRWEQSEPLAGLPAALPDSERLALLHEALRQRGWFDDGARWAIAGELAALFDELTAAAVVLPDDEDALATQLAEAYALRVSAPLALEARLVVELWRALAAVGRPDLASQRRLRLARLAEQAARPLLVLLDASPEEALDPAESEFLLRWGERQPLAVHYPAPRAAGATALQSVLAAAWPEKGTAESGARALVTSSAQLVAGAAADGPAAGGVLAAGVVAEGAVAEGAVAEGADWQATAGAAASPHGLPQLTAADDVAPLAERAEWLRAALPASPLAGHLQLVAATGREAEAEAAVAQVLNWIDAGCRRIALISQDRLTARRVRALLERENVLVADETGWKLSTSRAAASVDALLETVAGNAYHRDLLDLLKSPFVFADLAPADEGAAPAATGKVKEAAVFALEAALRAASARNGLLRMRRALREHAAERNAAATALAQQLLDRVDAAATLLADRPAPLARWIERLQKALDALGARAALAADPAGQALFSLLETRRDELAANTASFAFASFRDWLNREFEAGSFRDASISSPIVLTPLNAVALRRFDAAIVLGGDARQLCPGEGGSFFNAAVRRELGLRTHDEAQREMRRDLELLLASVPRVVVVWQSEIDGEANLLAPEFDLLSALHALAWGDDLRRAPLPWAAPTLVRGESDGKADGKRDGKPDGAPGARRAAAVAPVAPPALLPQRITVSAYASLVACPYRFFARHVLGLGEVDEVLETVGKRDYGALVHRVLEIFHAGQPLVSVLNPAAARTALLAITDEVFGPAIEENALALGWCIRWRQRIDAYLDWQRQREAAGWRWLQAETAVRRQFVLADGSPLELRGRIDRIDCRDRSDDGCALLDYKTQSVKTIRETLADDLQLPTYALLCGGAGTVGATETADPFLTDDSGGGAAASAQTRPGPVVEAAYVALDDDAIAALAAADGDAEALQAAARAHGERLVTAFAAMRAGAPLPAHGVETVCRWCEMAGLCRREHG